MTKSPAKSKALSRSIPTKPLEITGPAKPKARTTAKKAAKAAGSKANPAKRALSRKKSRKDITIARGAEREGALAMRTEEEIEAEARAEEESRKQEKRKNSKVAAASDKMKAKRRERKRARNKAKAEKKFDKAYGGDKGPSGSSATPSEGAPRPAIYEGKMGASHKKSAKLQAKAAGQAFKSAASSFSLPTDKLPDIPPKVSRILASVAVVAVCAFMLYGPAQNYYQQMRETDRLQAEYAAVAARNNTLQSTIDSLSSDEGIEDKAHADLGYVKQGEYTATVKGANIVDTTEFSSNVAPGSVSAPETWYSPVLDVLFGYSS